jgi:hypothetical protein
LVEATPRPLYSHERTLGPIVKEVGWAPVSVWTGAEIVKKCVFMRCGEFREQLSRFVLFKKDSLLVLNIWLVLLYCLCVRQSVHRSQFGG